MHRSLTFLLAAESDLSLDDLQQRIGSALRTQFGQNSTGDSNFWLQETFPGYVIAQASSSTLLYRIPYMLIGETVKFGDAQEVEEAYIPVAEACEFATAEADASDADDRVYPIVVLKAGWAGGTVDGNSTPHYYPKEFVAQVAEALNSRSVPFGRKHPDQKGSDPAGAVDALRIAGWLEGGAMSGDSAVSSVKLLAAESDLRSRLGEARKAKKLSVFGTSMLAHIGWIAGQVEGKKALIATKLAALHSVDLCARGGAGGQFLTAEAALNSEFAAAQLGAVKPNTRSIAPNTGRIENPAGGTAMKSSLQRLLESLRLKNPSKSAELTMKFALSAEADYPALMEEVTTALTATDSTAAITTVITAEAATATLNEAKRIQSKNRIAAKVAASKLPRVAADHVTGTLETRLAAEADLSDESIDAEITRTRTAFAAFEETGRPQPRIHSGIVLDSADKLRLAAEAMMGVKESMGQGVPAFRGIREMYQVISGDQSLEKLTRGGGFTGMRYETAAEAIVSGDFPNLLLNSQTKRLLQDWAELTFDNLKVLYTKASISDYKVQNRVRDGYFDELAIVGEGEVYPEIAYPTDEGVTYQVEKRGGLLTISEETIRNDDLGAISRFPGRMARAARKTLASYISNFFIGNPAYQPDALNWFSEGHSNLSTDALSVDALIAAEIALGLQTESNSEEALGLPLNWLLVPLNLKSTANAINQTDTAGSNQFFHRFGPNNERIIVNPKLDANSTTNWYYGTDQNNAPFIEMGFLDGIEEPQIFLANMPTVGLQFTTDELQYKIKHVYNGQITDYRGVGAAIVAG